MNRKKMPPWVLSLFLAGGGIGVAGLLILIFLIAFPQYRPGYTVFTMSMGDILIDQGKWVKPIPNPNEILAAYPLAWDELGFRINERPANDDEYTIIALGDSYTEAPNVPRPWTDVLAGNLALPVRNLGYRGFGPAEYVRVLERVDDLTHVETIVVGFFEGNDLSNAVNSFENPSAVKMPWEISDDTRQLIKTDIGSFADRDERYPMVGSMGGKTFDLVFYENYLWALNGSKSHYRNSLNMRLTMESFASIRAMAPETCIVVAYFPTKSHIYLPYLNPESQSVLLQKAQRNRADPGEKLQLVPSPDTSFDDLLDRLPNMRDTVQEMMLNAGFIFFDLSPAFEAAAQQGEMLYYTYDTHWNQDGHNLAGKAIADFLSTRPCERQSDTEVLNQSAAPATP